MSVPSELRTPDAALIEEVLGREFPQTRAYRYNPASLRVRVVDDRFRGRSRTEREAMVLPLLEGLPEEVRSDLMILLLLAPEEGAHSLMNLEFENPSPTGL